MDKEYFTEYYILERNHWWFKVREIIIEDKLRKYACDGSKTLKILNIGAATGKSSEMLKQFGDVLSIEFDVNCYEFTKKNVDINIILGSILNLPFIPKSFDVVCAFDVIEHVKDDEKAISEMKRVCKDNGVVCVTVPAFEQLWSYHDEVNHHIRRYNMKELISLFPKFEGSILYKSYFNSLLFLPIYLFRLISIYLPNKWVRNGSGSDFSINTKGVINKTLYTIFYFERLLLKRITFPVGVSILLIWKK